MIGKLRGIVDSVSGDGLVLDVHGVGYLLTCPISTMDRMPDPGAETALVVETQVREDSIRLFGFGSEVERDWFRLLQTVQGVGAKVALAMLGVMSPSEVGTAIVGGDVKGISKTPGVGPKLASRVVSELAKAAESLLAVTPNSSGALPTGPVAMDRQAEDAVSGIVNLGYARARAVEAVLAAQSEHPDASVNDLLRHGLRRLYVA